jgi:hypothetical protein
LLLCSICCLQQFILTISSVSVEVMVLSSWFLHQHENWHSRSKLLLETSGHLPLFEIRAYLEVPQRGLRYDSLLTTGFIARVPLDIRLCFVFVKNKYEAAVQDDYQTALWTCILCCRFMICSYIHIYMYMIMGFYSQLVVLKTAREKWIYVWMLF